MSKLNDELLEDLKKNFKSMTFEKLVRNFSNALVNEPFENNNLYNKSLSEMEKEIRSRFKDIQGVPSRALLQSYIVANGWKNEATIHIFRIATILNIRTELERRLGVQSEGDQ